jgi:hypothetical protein
VIGLFATLPDFVPSQIAIVIVLAGIGTVAAAVHGSGTPAPNQVILPNGMATMAAPRKTTQNTDTFNAR